MILPILISDCLGVKGKAHDQIEPELTTQSDRTEPNSF